MIVSISVALAMSATAIPPVQNGNASPNVQGATPPPEFIETAQAFGRCLGANASKLPATVEAEPGAKQIVAACADQMAAMKGRFEAWITGPGFPEAGRGPAREELNKQLAGVEPQLVAKIRQSRSAK